MENKDGNKTLYINVDNLKASVHNIASSELNSKPSTNVSGTPSTAARSVNPHWMNFIWHGVGGGV
jgi:hypothetical protein